MVRADFQLTPARTPAAEPPPRCFCSSMAYLPPLSGRFGLSCGRRMGLVRFKRIGRGIRGGYGGS